MWGVLVLAGVGVRGDAELRLGRLKPDTTGASHGVPGLRPLNFSPH